MFLKKLKRELAQEAEYRRDVSNDLHKKYWELRGDIDRLVKALGMTKDYRVINDYIKKGDPERGAE